MEGLTNREAGELITDIKYLKECCAEVKKEMDITKTRTSQVFISVILLLAGVIINLILTYAK
jgi:hypothetical protein